MFLEFEGIENVRDLGGLMRIDGAKTRPGLLLRTGRLEKATDADIQRLSDMGLAHVVDFRDASEIRRAPDRPVPGAQYHALPALPNLQQNFRPVDDPTYTAQDVHDDFSRIYRYLAQSSEAVEAYAAFFRVLLESEGRPVLFHCTQGKDRTGVAALLLLTALGVDEDTILRDYLLTNEYTGRTLAAFEQMDAPPFAPDIAREVFLVFEENLRAYRHCLEVEYGSVSNYLELVLDVGPREIERLEDFYLDRPDELMAI